MNCYIRGIFMLKNSLFSTKEFNRSTKNSKWTLKSKNHLLSVTDPISSNLGLKCLIKPLIFTVSFTGSCFVAATIWQYEDIRNRVNKYFNLSPLFEINTPRYKRSEIRRQINAWWQSQTDGQMIAIAIGGINLFVFCLWRIPSCHPFLRKYFCASPALDASCLPMILSTFSHYSFFHLAANMFVLYSFSTPAVAHFGREQFLAIYGSAAVFSSFTSYAYKIITGRLATSLGASGALLAILSSMCIQYPDSQLHIILLPFFTFSAGNALKTIVALDIVGLFAKWKLFDHAAHLGGALFGVLYLLYGQEFIWSQRHHILRWYLKIRGKGT